MFRLFLALIVALAIALKATGEVLHLSADNFDGVVDGSTNVLVEFYAPWCGHCKNLAPEWKIAGETFQSGDDIKIADVDATESQALASKFGVTGYPTIKFFPKGSTSPQEYTGGRTADTIVKWVNDKVGTSRKVKLPPSFVTTLTADNFDDIVLGEKAALVEFYAPWCGHCKQLAPKYEELGRVFAAEGDVVIGKVDATEEAAVADKFSIQGYPTLKYFPAGSSEPEDYNEARELEAMVQFINRRAGTARTADGNLLPSAGRIAVVDALLSGAEFRVDAAVVEDVKTAAAALEGREVAYGKLYVSFAEKVLAKGADYVSKELARIAKMASSPSIKPESKGAFQLKQNILRAFSAETAALAQEAEKVSVEEEL